MAFIAQGAVSGLGNNRAAAQEHASAGGVMGNAAALPARPQGSAFVRLEMGSDVVMLIPLQSDRGVVAGVSDADSVPRGVDEAEARRATLEAACWLMPSLSAELIAEVLGLGAEAPEAESSPRLGFPGCAGA